VTTTKRAATGKLSATRGPREAAAARSQLWRLLPWALLLPACQQLLGYDSARCQQSAATVRQALALEQFESARQWRDYTWKACSDDDRALVATLDKEILDAETAADAKAKAAEAAKKLAQQRINAAQKAWFAFDASKPEERTRENLDATRKSAARLEEGLPPEYARQIAAYNDSRYEKRLAALGR
jgi:phytoene dehydrogenase-like protein